MRNIQIYGQINKKKIRIKMKILQKKKKKFKIILMIKNQNYLKSVCRVLLLDILLLNKVKMKMNYLLIINYHRLRNNLKNKTKRMIQLDCQMNNLSYKTMNKYQMIDLILNQNHQNLSPLKKNYRKLKSVEIIFFYIHHYLIFFTHYYTTMIYCISRTYSKSNET